MLAPADRRPCVAVRTPVAPEVTLSDVLEVMRSRTGLDFSGYRQPTLGRRVRNRMIALGETDLARYVERLGRDPDEPARLLERLTIKVSRFFRNPAAFAVVADALADLRRRDPGRRLSAWSAGCGRGEEPYSLAILLAELGQQPAGIPDVLATDVDPQALRRAALGSYAPRAVTEVPTDLRDRWLVPVGAGEIVVAEPIRRGVAFALHDLTSTQEAPGGRRFDLVCCRNVVIYLDPTLQWRVQDLLVRSVRPGGLLWLGDAEWVVPGVAAGVEVVDRRWRVFRVPRATEVSP